MSYTPTTYVEGVTKLGPTNMNHLETGVQAVGVVADAAVAKPIAPVTNAGLVWSGSAWVAALLVNGNIDPAANIAYSKLTLAGSIINNDIASGAAIAYSKLSLTGGIVNTDVSAGAAIAQSKLANGPGFEYAYNAFSADVTITATSAATAQAVVAGTAVTYDGSTIFVEFFSPYGINVAGNLLNFELYDGVTDVALMGSLGAAAAINGPIYLRTRIAAASGSHTYNIKAWTGGGSATVKAGTGSGGGSLVNGFVRVVKA